MSLEENYYDVNITLGVAYVVDTLNIKDIKDKYIGQYLEPALFSQIMGCSQIEAKRIINDKLQLLCDDIDALIFNLGIDLRPILIDSTLLLASLFISLLSPTSIYPTAP